MIKNYVIFDFVGTIATTEPCRESILLSLLESQGVSEVGLNRVVDAYEKTDGQFTYSSISEAKDSNYRPNFYLNYNLALVKYLGVESSVSVDALTEEFLNYDIKWKLFDDTLFILTSLEQAGFKLGILSNFGPSLKLLVEKLVGEKVKFSHVMDSASTGLEKPDLDFFNYFLAHAQLNPENCIFIGDSYDLDYIPATEVGIKTFLVDRKMADISSSSAKMPLTEIAKKILEEV